MERDELEASIEPKKALERLLAAANGLAVYPHVVGQFKRSQGDDAIIVRQALDELEELRPVVQALALQQEEWPNLS